MAVLDPDSLFTVKYSISHCSLRRLIGKQPSVVYEIRLFMEKSQSDKSKRFRVKGRRDRSFKMSSETTLSVGIRVGHFKAIDMDTIFQCVCPVQGMVSPPTC